MTILTGAYQNAAGNRIIVVDPVATGVMAVGGPLRFHGDDIATAMQLIPQTFEMLIVSEKSLADSGYELVQ